MSSRPDPSQGPLRVLIAGGGVAGLEAALAMHAMAGPRVELTMVSYADHFHYRPLEVGEPFGLGPAHRHSLEKVAHDIGMRLVRGAVDAWHPRFHSALLQDGDELDCDVLVVAIGAHPCPAYEHGVTFDREHDAESFEAVLADLGEGFVPHLAFVVPDGVTWSLPAYELALLTVDWARRTRPDGVRVTLVTHEPEPLSGFGGAASAAVARVLAEAGVVFAGGVNAEVLSDTALRLDGTWLTADRIVSLPHVVTSRLPGVPCDDHGFMAVDEYGRVAGVEDVYAAGDVTSHHVKQGGLAAQQADVIARHIAQRAGKATEARPYRPVLRGLLSTADGPLYLQAALDPADATPATASRDPLWWPPAKIAAPRLNAYLAAHEATGAQSAGEPRPGAPAR